MSALASAKGEGAIVDAVVAACRPIFANAIWAWFDANKDRALFTKKILFFPAFTIRIADFEGIVSEIAGNRPAA